MMKGSEDGQGPALRKWESTHCMLAHGVVTTQSSDKVCLQSGSRSHIVAKGQHDLQLSIKELLKKLLKHNTESLRITRLLLAETLPAVGPGTGGLGGWDVKLQNRDLHTFL